MSRIAIALLTVVSIALASGCKEEKKDTDTATTGGQTTKPHGHEHKGDGGTHTGPKHALGKQEIAGYTVSVKQVGHIKAGAGATFEIVTTGGADKPKAVRAWVG